MIKLWCYCIGDTEILQYDFEDKPKSYKFIDRPSGFNAMVLKDNVEKMVGTFAFSRSKEDLIKIVKKSFDNNILIHKKKISEIERLRDSLDNI